MFSHARIIASVLAGAVLISSPMQALAQKPSAKQQVALPNAPFSVQPAKAVIQRYQLLSLLSPLSRQNKRHVRDLTGIERAIVFEGNVTLDEPIDIGAIASKKTALTPFEQALIHRERLLVIHGDLHCRGLSTYSMDAVFVLGNVHCETVDLSIVPFYVKGNLVARKSLLGSAYDDGGDGREGERHVVVGGTVSSPKVRTWYFSLGHLRFALESAKEVLVETEHEKSDGPCFGDKDC
ncbi:hypothetical protein F1735_28410 [Massilia sp. CCM 8694]|uniref:Uncharacterized protein n=1 Tax=Massilia genomosp. 1 TaxID=2609280 RepID=A0ABX0N3S3_9BURK|nr:hypothetical protein [Massilia genomosp. 1]